LKLTIAHWLTPNGVDVNGKGIEPDVKISATDADRSIGNDPVLNRALLYLR
jgi:C-terminal processing protease CtpA/Prc